jgi:hypothetical protein
MKPIRLVVLLLYMLSFTACSTGKYDRLAADYRRRSPIAEAEKDFGAHDYKIYSAMGLGHYYPGLKPDVGQRIAKEYGEKMLSGTSDALVCRSQANYIDAATRFASDYNKRKASLIERISR